MQTTPYLTRPAAAEYVRSMGLPCQKSTLGKLATLGGGPAFHKFGKAAVYAVADLDAWVSARLSTSRCSTTQVSA